MTPARPDVPCSTDFSLHWFGIPDAQVHAFWKMLERLPASGRQIPCKMDCGTRVRVKQGIDSGLEGIVDFVDGGLRRVCFKRHWAKIPTEFLEIIT
jgi:hypothetical protein